MDDLCETFRSQSGRVWNRMAKAPTVGMSLSEETLTETALYEIALAHQGAGEIEITIATKTAEARHGADWEWWLVKGNICLSFRVQAKRLFPNRRYQSLLKASPNQYVQLDKLIAVSQQERHIPLYCFFNFPSNLSYSDNWRGHCRHSYRGPSFWGCSLASPEDVKAVRSDSFNHLRPVMYPWHKLVCDQRRNRGNLVETARDFISGIRRGTPITTRPISDAVGRLIQTKRRRDEQHFIDYAFFGDEFEQSLGHLDDLAGLLVIEDLRS
jgi:hypothetical protein